MYSKEVLQEVEELNRLYGVFRKAVKESYTIYSENTAIRVQHCFSALRAYDLKEEALRQKGVPLRFVRDGEGYYELKKPFEVKLIRSIAASNLSGSNLSNAKFSGRIFSGLNLAGANLSNANLSGAHFEEANFAGADLSDAGLYWTELSRANFSQAHLERVDLTGSNLSNANFSRANLSNANLGGADLNGTNFTDAILRGANLGSFSEEVMADPITNVMTYNTKFRNTNLSGANLSEADLSGLNLTNANLSVAKNLEKANFREANLSGINFSGMNLYCADLSRANLSKADLSQTNLNGAIIRGANLHRANFNRANLSYVQLRESNLNQANFEYSILEKADLSGTFLCETKFRGATLTGCRIYAISAWKIQIEEAKQKNLIITNVNEPEITVDNLEVAQFIYLLLNNQKIRQVIDTITSKVVLILGRFTLERKAVLDALRDELRYHDLLPVVFDFEGPRSRNLTETVSTLAHMSRFIIADLTDAKSIPQELERIVPRLRVPVQSLLHESEKEAFAMYRDFEDYHWVLPIYRYQNIPHLLGSIKEKIIAPVEEKARNLEERK